MLVTQSIESNVNVLARKPTADNILSVLKSMPFDVYHCRAISDAFVIPHFVLFLDGNILTENNKDIDLWECYLGNWSGRMKKCFRCLHYRDCVCEKSSEEDDGDKEQSGPDFIAPTILLHENRRQREVEGLITLIPPMPVNESFSNDLEDWIQSISLAWHKKALKWRKMFNQWYAIERYRDSLKPKTNSEIAKARWTPRQITLKLRSPDYISLKGDNHDSQP